jgi:Mg/Co/Ni transporter MgtE
MVFDYVAGKQDWLANALPIEGKLAETATIGSLADHDVPTCHLAEKLGEVQNRLRATHANFCVVINDARIVLGLLRKDRWDGDAEQSVSHIMELGPATFRPHVTAKEMADHIRQKKLAVILVTTSGGRLIGALRQEDLSLK